MLNTCRMFTPGLRELVCLYRDNDIATRHPALIEQKRCGPVPARWSGTSLPVARRHDLLRIVQLVTQLTSRYVAFRPRGPCNRRGVAAHLPRNPL